MTIALNLLADVRWRGKPVAGDRPQALLAALAGGGGRPVRAEELIDLVWGDEAPLNGMKSLQVLVARARNGEEALATVKQVRPEVFIIPTWDSAHPTVNVLNTLFSKAIYPGDRDVFATLVKQENRIANKKTDDLKSRNGHIVLRVEPGGSVFSVHILSNADENDTVEGIVSAMLALHPDRDNTRVVWHSARAEIARRS